MSSIFFVKWSTKWFGRRVEGGGGQGGSRRLEKMEKSFLGLEKDDSILDW